MWDVCVMIDMTLKRTFLKRRFYLFLIYMDVYLVMLFLYLTQITLVISLWFCAIFN